MTPNFKWLISTWSRIAHGATKTVMQNKPQVRVGLGDSASKFVGVLSLPLPYYITYHNKYAITLFGRLGPLSIIRIFSILSLLYPQGY